MKGLIPMKRFLSLALALVLGLAMFIPAFAADAVDPNAPIITKQPGKNAIGFFLKAGEDLELEVTAQLPEGIEGELSYAWYDWNDYNRGNEAKPVAIGEKVTILTSENMVVNEESPPKSISVKEFAYCVVVTNTYVDAGNVEQTASICSEPVVVSLFLPLGSIFSSIWNDLRSEGGIFYSIIKLVLMSPFLLPSFAFIVVPGILFMTILSFFGPIVL